MGKVSIARIDHGIEQGLSQALEIVGGLEQIIKPADTVMLKPNLNGEEGCTDKGLVESLIQMLFDLNVKRGVFMNSGLIRRLWISTTPSRFI